MAKNPQRIQPGPSAPAPEQAAPHAPEREAMQTETLPGPVAAAHAAAEAQQRTAELPQPTAAAEPGSESGEDRGPGRRPERIAFGHQQQQLELPQRPGFMRRWFNDSPGRIDRARRAWWEHVKDPANGENVSRIVGVAKQGGGLRSYAMELPLHLYEEDKAKQQAIIDEFDEAMEQGAVNGKQPGDDGRYVPMQANKPRIDIKQGAGISRSGDD